MAYERAAALAYLQGEFAALLADTGLASGDTQIGFKSTLDNAYRALGVAHGSLQGASVDDSEAEKLEALLDYYALRRFVRVLASRVSISKGMSGSTVSKQRQQAYSQVQQDMKDAKERVTELGLLLVEEPAEYGLINLDFLEPAET